jgi:hypothetical protein
MNVSNCLYCKKLPYTFAEPELLPPSVTNNHSVSDQSSVLLIGDLNSPIYNCTLYYLEQPDNKIQSDYKLYN